LYYIIVAYETALERWLRGDWAATQPHGKHLLALVLKHFTVVLRTSRKKCASMYVRSDLQLWQDSSPRSITPPGQIPAPTSRMPRSSGHPRSLAGCLGRLRLRTGQPAREVGARKPGLAPAVRPGQGSPRTCGALAQGLGPPPPCRLTGAPPDATGQRG
jgi:hypothetical protein